MIKIQLCPPEELENPHWWAADVAVAAIILIAAYFGSNWYLGTIQEEIDRVEASAQSLKESTIKLKPDLERFKTLDADIVALNTKLKALQKVTVSKIARYKPLIAVEHFQNLRPEGVWFKALKIGINGKDDFDLIGQGFDNLIIAEFMTAIRATDSQDKDEGDLRTQVSFTDLGLAESVLGKQTATISGLPDGFAELAKYPTFHIMGHFIERTEGATAIGSGSGSGSGSFGTGSASGPDKDKAPKVISEGPDNDDSVKL